MVQCLVKCSFCSLLDAGSKRLLQKTKSIQCAFVTLEIGFCSDIILLQSHNARDLQIIVSPIARATASRNAEMIPESAAGTTTFNETSNLVLQSL